MRKIAVVTLLVSVLGAPSAWGEGAAPPRCCASNESQCAPAGGWFPYGGGLLRWLPCCRFPDCGGPDDYCRKPLPCLCWPAYPHHFKIIPTACDRTACGSAVTK